MWPLLLLITPFFFYNDLYHLLFTYLCPIVPFIVVFDGYVSSLRTRTPEEVKQLLDIAAKRVAKRLKVDGHGEDVGGEVFLKQWKFRSGSEMHTPPIGTMSWIVCTKEHS